MLEFQNCHYVKGLDPVADAFSGTVYSDIVNVAGYHSVNFIVYCGVGATGTSLFTVEPCLNKDGTPGTAIPFHYREILSGDTEGTLTACAYTGFTSTAGSSKIIVISVESQALAASGYSWVRLKAVQQTDSEVEGCILIELCCPRYAHEPADTAIA